MNQPIPHSPTISRIFTAQVRKLFQSVLLCYLCTFKCTGHTSLRALYKLPNKGHAPHSFLCPKIQKRAQAFFSRPAHKLAWVLSELYCGNNSSSGRQLVSMFLRASETFCSGTRAKRMWTCPCPYVSLCHRGTV